MDTNQWYWYYLGKQYGLIWITENNEFTTGQKILLVLDIKINF